MVAIEASETKPKSSAPHRIPSVRGWPVVGSTVTFLRDPIGVTEGFQRQHGDVYRIHNFGRWAVTLLGADALELVLLDREKNFSSYHGWKALQRLFPGGLLLRDFDDHRHHRRIMQAAFKSEPMAGYVRHMNDCMEQRIEGWKTDDGPLIFYFTIKNLTLDLATEVFLGLRMGEEAQAVRKAFMDELQASIGLVRYPVPGSKMWRGVQARRFLIQFVKRMIPGRRESTGEDMVSQLCRARSQEGEQFADQDVADHLNLLLMAAHDTTTSALTTMMYELARHPEWQEELRKEAGDFGGRIEYEDMDRAVMTDRVFREALRLRPPVPFIPRHALRPFEYAGRTIPGETDVSLCPGLVTRDPALWTRPHEFDPDRFSPNRAEDRRHRFAWTPFGGGAHKCIGMHFATMQAKAFTVQLLNRYRVSLPESHEPEWRTLPMPMPKDGLPVILEPIH